MLLPSLPMSLPYSTVSSTREQLILIFWPLLAPSWKEIGCRCTEVPGMVHGSSSHEERYVMWDHRGPSPSLSLSFGVGSLSALKGHGRDELLHLVGQPLLPRLFILLQGCGDLWGKS